MSTTKIALLVSRQPRLVNASTWWLRAIWNLSLTAKEKDWTLVSGRGLPWLDFATWAFRKNGARVVPRDLTKDLGMAGRDDAVFEESDIQILVAVRTNGIMADLAERALSRGTLFVAVSNSENISSEWISRGGHPLYLDIDDVVQLKSALPNIAVSSNTKGFLWHYTRSFSGPWPDETEDEYFEKLALNLPGADHTATDSLARIIKARKIIGCEKMIRGKYPVVCLSEEPPEALLSLRRFKPALIRWNFEPAAVGIPRDWAEQKGVRPVHYLKASEFEEMDSVDRYLFQKHEPPDVDFTDEKEWRQLGNLDFSDLGDDALRMYIKE